MSSPAKILVTGATGFVGCALLERLRTDGFDVTGLNSSVSITSTDYFDVFADNGPYHVFHLAGKVFVPESWTNPLAFFEVNTFGTARVLEFCRNTGSTCTFVSSYLYGKQEKMPISETAVLQPGNPYALSKKVSEELCMYYHSFFGVNTTIIRPFNIYGPRQAEDFLLPKLIRQALSAQGEVQVYDLTPRRDYLYIDDFITLLLKTIGRTEGGVFNAGFGKSYSIPDIVALLEDLLDKRLTLSESGDTRINEIPDTVADISKASVCLGWKPEVDIREGVKRMVEHYYFNKS